MSEPFDDPALALEAEVHKRRRRARLIALASLVTLPALVYVVYRLASGIRLGPFEVVVFCCLVAILMTGWTTRRLARRSSR